MFPHALSLLNRRFFLWLVLVVTVGDLIGAVSASGNGYSVNTTTGQQTDRTWTLTYTVTFVSPNYKIHYTATSSLGGVYISGNRPGQPSGLIPTGSTVHSTGLEVRAIYSNANNIVYLNTPLLIPAQVTAEPQTIVISPITVNPLKVGQPATFTASGGQTSYSWTATGNPEISGTGDSRTLTWSEEGVWTVSVYAVAGSGYPQSNTATASAFVAKEITVRIPVKNGNPVGSGVLVAGIGKKNGVANNDWTTGVLQPGQMETVVIDGVKTGDVVTVDIVRVGVKKDPDGNLVPGNSDFNLGPVDYILIESDTIDHSTTYSGDLEVPETASTVNVVKGEIQDADKSVWTPSDPENTATDGTMKQGFDKTVSALDAINSTLKEINAKTGTGGTGGGGTGTGEFSDAGTHERLDTANSHLEKLVAQADEMKELKEETPSSSDMTNAGNAAKSDAESVVTQVTGRSGYASGAQPNLTVTLPAAFGGKVFDMNPFQSGRFSTICAWIKGAIAWLCIIGWAIWAWGEVKENFVIGLLAPQAKGNAVLGGTGGQITALAAAAAITVALGAFFLAMLGKFSGDWSIGSIALMATSDPMIGLGAGALWMIEQIIPVATVLGTFVFRLVFKTACIKLVLGVAAVIRFIVP